MTPTVRGTVQTATKASGGTDLLVPLDATIVGGELLIVEVTQAASGQTVGTPAGWTADINLGQGANTTNTKSWLFHKVAVAGDAGTTVTFSSSVTQAMTGASAAIYDADGGTFDGTLDGTPVSSATGVDATTFATSGSLTTTQANSLVIFTLGMGKTGGGSFTPPAGTPTITELADVTVGPCTSTLAMMTQATAGAVTTRTWTASGTFDTIAALVAAYKLTDPTPTFVGAGTLAATATNGATLAPGLPAGWAADDVHVLLVHRSDNTAITTPSGWTKILPSTAAEANTSAQIVSVYLRRAVAGDTAPTVTAGTSTVVRMAQIFGIRGCPTTSTVDTVIDVMGRNNNAAAATIVAPTVTTTSDTTLALFLGAYEDDPTTGSQPSGWSTVSNSNTALGNDASFFWATRAVPATSTALGTTTTTVSGGTFANSVNVGIVLVFKPTVNVQNVTLPQLTNAPTLYAPSVTAGDVAVTLPLLTVTPTIYALTSQATNTVTLPQISATPTLFAPTVAAGSVNVTLPLLANTPTLFAPSSAATAAITLPLLSAAPTLYTPTLGRGSVNVALPLLSAPATLYAPSVAPGAVSVTLPLLSVAPTVYAPTSAATNAITLPLLSNAPTLFAPTIGRGAVSVTLPLLSATPTLYAPTVSVAGTSAITLPVLSVVPSLFAPTVTATAAITLPLLNAAPTLFAPSVQASNALTLPLITVTPTLLAPSVARGAVAVTLPLLSVSPTLYAPVVSGSASNVVLPLLSVSPTLYQPTVTRGAVNVTLPFLTVSPTVYTPTVTPGAAALTLPLLVVSPSLYAPSVAASNTIALPLLTVGGTLYAPGVEAGAAVLALPLLVVAPTLYAPTVISGNIARRLIASVALTPTLSAHVVRIGPIATVALVATSRATVHLQPARGAVSLVFAGRAEVDE